MNYVSLERRYFVLYDGAHALKTSRMALNPLSDETLHIGKHDNNNMRTTEARCNMIVLCSPAYH